MSIPAERQEHIAAAIVDLQARGEPPTNDNVLALVGGGRKFVTSYMKAWRQQQQQHTAVPVVDGAPEPPAVPAPVPRPASCAHLEALRQRVAAAEEHGRRLVEEQRHAQRELAEARSMYQNALIDVQRLARQIRQHRVLARNPVSPLSEEMQSHVNHMHAQLAGLIGPEETQRVLVDQDYGPWWLTAR
jgi:hypothetical protein